MPDGAGENSCGIEGEPNGLGHHIGNLRRLDRRVRRLRLSAGALGAAMSEFHVIACLQYLWLLFNGGTVEELRAAANLIHFGCAA